MNIRSAGIAEAVEDISARGNLSDLHMVAVRCENGQGTGLHRLAYTDYTAWTVSDINKMIIELENIPRPLFDIKAGVAELREIIALFPEEIPAGQASLF